MFKYNIDTLNTQLKYFRVRIIIQGGFYLLTIIPLVWIGIKAGQGRLRTRQGGKFENDVDCTRLKEYQFEK